MREFRYVICDVFTDRPLEGNPLAVFTDARGIPEPLLQPLARELNLSETVFCYPARGTGHVRIRIFTPDHELPFAGHPVLGSAFVLAAPLQLPEIVLETGMGPVPVRLERDGPRIVFGWMVQPVPRVEAVADPAPVLRALGVERAALPVELYDNGPRHLCVALESEAAVAALQPDMPGAGASLPPRHDELLCGDRPALQDARLRAGRRRPGGPGHRLRRRAARLSPGAPRPDPLRGGDRDPAGRGDQPAERSLREGRGHRGRDRTRRGGGVGGDRRPRRVPAAGLRPPNPRRARADRPILEYP